MGRCLDGVMRGGLSRVLVDLSHLLVPKIARAYILSSTQGCFTVVVLSYGSESTFSYKGEARNENHTFRR